MLPIYFIFKFSQQPREEDSISVLQVKKLIFYNMLNVMNDKAPLFLTTPHIPSAHHTWFSCSKEILYNEDYLPKFDLS